MKPAAAFALVMLAASPTRADDDAAIDQLLNFVAHGCVASVVDAASLQAFVMKEQAVRADEKTAQALLGTDKGRVYLKADAQHPIAITARDGNVCTVNARFAGDLASVIEVTNDYFVGPGSRFYPGRVFEEASPSGGWVTHRVYLGQRADKQITVLFSTDPKAPALSQIIVTVAAEKKP